MRWETTELKECQKKKKRQYVTRNSAIKMSSLLKALGKPSWAKHRMAVTQIYKQNVNSKMQNKTEKFQLTLISTLVKIVLILDRE